jgi:hypothetical protein
MNEAIPSQHPAVVLRSHYQHLRALLGVTMVAVLGLTAAVVILATQNNSISSSISSPARVASPAIPASPQTATPGATTRFDGGPEEGTRGLSAAPAATARFDGGPEEGTRGILAAPLTRPVNPSTYNGGHDEGPAGH